MSNRARRAGPGGHYFSPLIRNVAAWYEPEHAHVLPLACPYGTAWRSATSYSGACVRVASARPAQDVAVCVSPAARASCS